MLRANFDDATNGITFSYSTDGGNSFSTPFDAIPSQVSPAYPGITFGMIADPRELTPAPSVPSLSPNMQVALVLSLVLASLTTGLLSRRRLES